MSLHLYTIVGFLKNYAGGFSLENHIVQRLFHNLPHHAKAAELLYQHCEDFLRDYQVSSDLYYDQTPQREIKTIYSFKVVWAVYVFLKNRTEFLGRDYLLLSEELFEPLQRQEGAGGLGYQQRIAFLRGVCLSNYRDESKLYFYNDHRKCLLSYHLLHQLADDEDELQLQSFFNTPQTDVITLSREGPLWEKVMPKELLAYENYPD